MTTTPSELVAVVSLVAMFVGLGLQLAGFFRNDGRLVWAGAGVALLGCVLTFNLL